jgi:hypothetical protein
MVQATIRYVTYPVTWVKRFNLNYRIEVYLRYNREEDRHLFGFEEVTEYFCGTDYKYIKGVVNLVRLYENREHISRADVFIINTGRKIDGATISRSAMSELRQELNTVEETNY